MQTNTLDDVRTDLETAWEEHRRYVGFAAIVFVLGTVAGVLMVGRFDLFGAIGLESAEDLIPDRLTVLGLLINNTRALAVMVAGALTLGLLTLFGLAFNGIILGYIATPVVADQGIGVILVGILPHGVLELPAYFVAGAIGFRIVKRTLDRLRGKNDVVLGRDGWRRAATLFAVAWVMLAIAAFIELYVTGALLQLLYG